MTYLARLRLLDYSQSLATVVDSRVVLLTGQSSFRSSRLTADQIALLRGVPGVAAIELGFPFHPAFDVAAPEPGILSASLRNGLQFLWSLRGDEAFAKPLQPLFSNTRRALSIITGSCGLQMLNAAWPYLVRPAGLELRIVAIGPVTRRNRLPVIAISGRRDLWSRLLYRGPVAYSCECGHLDYWSSPEVHALVRSACG